MSAMAKTLGGFRAALLIGWVALGVAGMLYARWKGIPSWAALPVDGRLPRRISILSGYRRFRGVRERLIGASSAGSCWPRPCCPTWHAVPGRCNSTWVSVVRLVALALAFGAVVRRAAGDIAIDVAFLALIGGSDAGRIFRPGLPLGLYPGFKDLVILGHVTLIYMAVLVLMLERRIYATGLRISARPHGSGASA